MLMETMTSEEFARLSQKVKSVIIPVGSIEAHGPHLPLATDLYTIYEICKTLIEDLPIFLAPPLYFGVCRSTRDLPGTISIRGETLKSLLRDILYSFYRQGLKNFIILSGHAGGTHNAFLIDTAENFIEEFKDTKFLVADIYSLLKEDLSVLGLMEEDSHAGEWETSLMLYLKKDLVKNLERSYQDYPKFPRFHIVRDKNSFWNSGIWGDPQRATPQKGQLLAAKLIEKIKNLIEEFWSS